MPSLPKWYDSADVAVTGPTTLTAQIGGTGTAVERRLWNNKGGVGAATLPQKRLKLLVRDPGQVYYVAAGHEWADQRYVEARIVSGLGTLAADASEWKKIGAGAYLELPEVPNADGLKLEFRLVTPFDATADSVQVLFKLASSGGVPITDGLTEATPDGIYLGLRDADFNVLVSSGGAVVENPGGADDQVQIPQQVWIAAGFPWTLRAGLLAAITPAAAGESRYDLLSLAADGTVTVTAGTETASPLTDADEPTLPSGEAALARLTIDDTGVIDNAKIVDRRELALCAASASSLTLTVAPGPYERIDNWFLWMPDTTTVALTDASVNWVWRLRSGSLSANTTGVKPEARALLLYKVTTAGGAVTAIEDHRFFIGYRSHRIEFRYDGELVAATTRIAGVDSERDPIIVPTPGALLVVDDIGAGTTGQLRFTVEAKYAGVWTALYAAAGDQPQFAQGATVLAGRFVPDRFDLERRSLIRAKVDDLPGSSGGDDPTDAVLSLELAL